VDTQLLGKRSCRGGPPWLRGGNWAAASPVGPCRVVSGRQENWRRRREVLASQSDSGFQLTVRVVLAPSVQALLCAANCRMKVLDLVGAAHCTLVDGGRGIGKMRDATDPREEPCIRARAGTRRRPFVAPVVRERQPRPSVHTQTRLLLCRTTSHAANRRCANACGRRHKPLEFAASSASSKPRRDRAYARSGKPRRRSPWSATVASPRRRGVRRRDVVDCWLSSAGEVRARAVTAAAFRFVCGSGGRPDRCPTLACPLPTRGGVVSMGWL
jgi:hypothetical protein